MNLNEEIRQVISTIYQACCKVGGKVLWIWSQTTCFCPKLDDLEQIWFINSIMYMNYVKV